jgi:hypothetical protein
MKRIAFQTKTVIVGLFLGLITTTSIAQADADSLSVGKVTIGGYAQIDFNQPFVKNQRNNALLDIHRMVMLFNYQYNSRLSFLTELEFEHVTEVYVEQAFLNYSFSPLLNLRAGLVLIPMGIINEYHEPPTYNGVERPMVDTRIVPSTWREMGFGFAGQIMSASLTYQVYVVNGFSSYNGTPLLKGVDALRGGRQKGAKSQMSHPNLSAKISHYGILGLEVGLSGYFGKTQSTLYNGIETSNVAALQKADSSVVNVGMVALDYRYSKGNFRSRGQLVYSQIGNSEAYNQFTGRDLGSAIMGYYGEVSYVIPFTMQGYRNEVEPFVRWEHYNTHYEVAGGLSKNDAYSYNGLGFGLGYRFHQNAMLKADYIVFQRKSDNQSQGVLSLGVGINF